MSVRQFLILAAIVVLATGAIGVRGAISGGALETHEVFVAQTAREMIARNDYAVPMFGGEVRMQKPPLMYWAVVGVAKAAGRPDVPPWAARLPSALSAMVLVGACIGIGALVFDRRTGLLAGAMVGFSAAVFEYGANARPEMLYAACTGLALLGFVGAVREPDRRRNLGWALLGWIGFGLATLAKGPHLPVLILLGLSFSWIRSRGWGAWARSFRPVLGLCVVAAMVAPWVILLMMRVDGAAAFWVNELVGARFDDDGAGFDLTEWLLAVITPRYLVSMVVLFLPWGVLAPVAFFVPWQKNRPDLAAGRDLFFAMVVPMVVLGLATRARDYYLLPVIPVIAPLLARGTIDLLEKAAGTVWTRRASASAVWVCAAGALAFGVGVLIFSNAAGAPWIVLLGAIACAGMIAVVVARAMPREWRAMAPIVALAAWGGAFGGLGQRTALGNERPEQVDVLAASVAHHAGTTMTVVSIGFDRDDLIYRLNRPIQRVARDADVSVVRALGPAVVVASPKVLDRLSADGLILERGEVFTIEGTERYEIARIGAAQNE